MQEYEDIYLRCSQCGEGFHSAACLLLHYSFHLTGPKHEQDSNKPSTHCHQNFQPEVEPFQDERRPMTNSISSLHPKSESEESLVDNPCQSVLTIEEGHEHPEDLCKSDFPKPDQDVEILSNCYDGVIKDGINQVDPFLNGNGELNSSHTTVDNTNYVVGKKKRYSCHLCPKIFGWSTDLKRHILVHTGERPFKCTSCSASFTRNFLLQKHSLKVHNVQNSERLQREVLENIKKLKASFYEIDKNKLKSPGDTRDNTETDDNITLNTLDNNKTEYTKLVKSSQAKTTPMEILSLMI